MEQLLAPFRGVLGEDPGHTGDETVGAEVGALPGAPGTGEIDGGSPQPDLVVLPLDSCTYPLDVLPRLRQGQPPGFAEVIVVAAGGRSQLGEFRVRAAYLPRAAQSAVAPIADLGAGNPLRQTGCQLHPFGIVGVRPRLDSPFRHTRKDTGARRFRGACRERRAAAGRVVTRSSTAGPPWPPSRPMAVWASDDMGHIWPVPVIELAGQCHIRRTSGTVARHGPDQWESGFSRPSRCAPNNGVIRQ